MSIDRADRRRDSGITLVTVDSAGQIMLPDAIRERLGIRGGDSLTIWASDDGIHARTLDQSFAATQAWLRSVGLMASSSASDRVTWLNDKKKASRTGHGADKPPTAE